ncbi:MAG: alanine--tRNA ligase [Anaerorhabdus sp.]
MKQLTGNQVRSLFLEYFKSHGHMVEQSANLIPYKDPTLLWINSGVAALKKYFDGSEKPSCNRITNSQKCIRTNDIENVGKTARHHTFFEMLGNFSIGDYFKEEAIQFAWEFLTSDQWLGMDKERFYISIYADDEEAFNIWVNKCGIKPERILRTPDNFWEIGEGPSGPNSEIFYDRGEKYDPKKLGEKLFFEELENDRYIEVWNVVFSQFDAKEGKTRAEYKELPQRNIDTGMGLERLVSLIQGGETNFDTDIFMPIIKATESYAKFPYEGSYCQAYRVVADHIRTVTFALSDGALFSNEGRGYVLRRILRRAVRYGFQLGIEGVFMHQLVAVVANAMNEFYPNLKSKEELVAKLVKNEEEAFHSTLTHGEKLLFEELEKAQVSKKLSGSTVFKLYDTFGFPKELTIEIAAEKGYQVDLNEFEREMAQQKERARNARVDEQSMVSQSEELMNFLEESKFIGYTEVTCKSKIIGLFKDRKKVDTLSGSGFVLLDNTCFYAESGGQIADTGLLIGESMQAKVEDVRKAPHGQHLHFVKVENGELKVGDELDGRIDLTRRLNIKANHSSVHLLQSALRKVIGEHVTQAGSYVTEEYARFDFTHFEKLTEEQLTQIETEVNRMIMASNQVITEILSIEDAKKSGALALFDEKYGDVVRVVTMGDVSKELCGGTHVANTQEIGIFKIESEESIGSGIRRLTTKTKLSAYFDFASSEKLLKSLAEKMKLNSVNLVSEKLESLLEEMSEVKKELGQQKSRMLVLEADQMMEKVKEMNGLQVLLIAMKNEDSSQLKEYAEILRNKSERSLIFIANTTEEDKVTFVSAASKVAIDMGLKAGDLVRIAAEMSDGKGGGRPDIAQGGGKGVKIQDIFATIEAKIME